MADTKKSGQRGQHAVGRRNSASLWARNQQLAPAGDWRIWMIMAGRGFGKTRAGAEWVREIASADPSARIALVGASLGETRAVMVEGESGILATSPPRRRPKFEPSLRRLTWPNGAQATIYSAGEAESLRGPQHSHAWCDEIAKWENVGGKAERAWDNLLLGLRLGEMPRLSQVQANPYRGEAALLIGGAPHLLRPSFSALVSAEEELGPLLALVERASAGDLRLGEIAALFWHCLVQKDGLTREQVGDSVMRQGLAETSKPLRTLLTQILQGTG